MPNAISPRLIEPTPRRTRDHKYMMMFIVRHIINRGVQDNYYTHGQLSSLVLGNGRESALIKSSLYPYYDYLIWAGTRFKFDLEALKRDHPEIWTGTKPNSNHTFDIGNIERALRDEIQAARRSPSKKYIRLQDIEKTAEFDGVFVFRGQIVDQPEQVDILPEGVSVKFKSGYFSTYVTILEQDLAEDIVIFQTSYGRRLPDEGDLEATPYKLYYKQIDLLQGLEDAVGFRRIKNWITNGFNPASVSGTQLNQSQALDESQKLAVVHALNHDLTYIWGPPGTGKSHTLANLLLNLYGEGGRTLVCSTANVAVDQLLLKFLAAADSYENDNHESLIKSNQVLRLGYVRDETLKARDEIFPENQEVRQLRMKLQVLEDKLAKMSKDQLEYDEILAKSKDARRKLAQMIERLTKQARIIFCTISKANLEEGLSQVEFDNLVLDEGSMVSAASMVLLSRYIGKRLVVAGDFRQLGPISISSSSMSEKWLKRSAFDLLSERMDQIPGHPAVRMLVNQRRCHPEIADILNQIFYEGRLNTIENERQHLYTGRKPGRGVAITFVDVADKPDFMVQRSAKQSRYNLRSLKEGWDLLRFYLSMTDVAKIGIITPYRSQVEEYRSLIDRNLDVAKRNRVKAGTIHSFQGSECDVIIFDMVDARNEKIGNLYYDIDGERLVNVAASRAISKLIVIGDHNILVEGQGETQVNPKIRRLINMIPMSVD